MVVPRAKVSYTIDDFKELMRVKSEDKKYGSYGTNISNELISDWSTLPPTIGCAGLEANDRRDPDRPLIWEENKWASSRHGDNRTVDAFEESFLQRIEREGVFGTALSFMSEFFND
jgi:hypothetical protein